MASALTAVADALNTVGNILTDDVLPVLGGNSPFLGGLERTMLNATTANVTTATTAVFNQSGTTINGAATQTSLVANGSNNIINSPASGADIVVTGSNDTVNATGASVRLVATGQNDHLNGTGGQDTFLLTGTGTETGNGSGNKFVLSTSPNATSGVTVGNFRTGSDQIGVAVTLDSTHTSVRNFDLIPSAQISPNQFGVGAAATTASERFVYNSTAGNLYFDPDGSGPAQARLIGHFAPGTPLAASDIHVVNGF
jgi:hypothetical protein